jgi:hypothetical protein
MTAIAAVLISVLRTVVPYVWGLFIGWLITAIPVLQPLENELLSISTLALPILIAAISAAWYALWRWLEPRLPDWLTRAVLGSAKAPTYPAVTGSQVAHVNPPLDRVPGPDHRA